MPDSKLLIYLLRRDLRLADNPIFAALADPQSKEKFTHVLPLYVFPAQQVEVSGFIPKDSGAKSPYPEARSALGGFWRCGQHRVKFLGESVWDLKQSLEDVGSGMAIRVGMVSEVVKGLVDGLEKEKENMNVSAVWMTAEEGNEEKSEEREVERVCDAAGIDFKLWTDEKYLIDEYVFSKALPSWLLAIPPSAVDPSRPCPVGRPYFCPFYSTHLVLSLLFTFRLHFSTSL